MREDLVAEELVKIARLVESRQSVDYWLKSDQNQAKAEFKSNGFKLI